MASVSILVPAFRPDYLGRALISAQTQTYTDIEILVGDDTADGSLADIVASIDDPRIRYFHLGSGDRRCNAAQLWERASGKYVKWLSGDDVLMPTSVEALADALAQNPDSAMAFHAGVFIGDNDAIQFVPPALLDPGECGILTRDSLVNTLVAEVNSHVCGSSNVMLVRDRVNMSAALTYGDLKLDALVDVAMYLNLAEQAPLTVVGGYLGALRRAAGEQSAHPNAASHASVYEWELIVRNEAAQGNLSAAGLKAAQQRLKDLYACANTTFPEFARLHANLDDLTALPLGELLSDARFQENLASVRAAAAQRVAASAPAVTLSAQAQKFCVVCENEVPHWLAVTGSVGGTPGDDFPGQLGFTGSALHKYACPRCHCSDRDRHLWLYFAVSGVLENAPQMRILHIAPEAHIEPRIRALEPREYVAGDLFPRTAAHQRINVEALDFPEAYFDLIICNDLLERVDDPRRALAEFNRCLAPGGHLVAQTPYSKLLKHTFELNQPVSPTLRTQYFGQDNYVRMFGADIAGYFHAAGLQGGLYPHEMILAEVDADQWGCNEHEPFFLFRKGALPELSNAPDKAAAHAAVTPVRTAPAVVAPAQPPRPIRLVVATRYNEADFEAKSALGRSLKLYNHAPPQQVLLFDNNTTGLSALYNRAIEHARDNPAVLVFIHDDVSLSDLFWVERIHEGLAHFDVIGLAGNKRRMPRQPAWAFTPELKWDDRRHLSGVVGHGNGFPCDIVSNFGPSGQEVKLLDGLMLAADSERLIESGLRFDEQFDFHFYDMDFCRQAEQKGLTMGTWPISVVHESGGAFGTPSWRAAYQRYLQKYTD